MIQQRKYTTMISSDIILDASSLMMLFFLFAWGGVIFVYRVLGGPRVGRDSLLYFNFIFLRIVFLQMLLSIFLC